MSELTVPHKSTAKDESDGGAQRRKTPAQLRRDSLKHLDLVFGQPVIVTARWIFVVSGLALALWNAGSMSELRLQFVVILLLAMTNFYLHAQLLMKRSIDDRMIYGSSAADLILITVLVLFQGGYDSSIYAFYFPAITALSVAFSRRKTWIYTAALIVVYFMICIVNRNLDLTALIVRLLMLAAVAVVGSRYLEIEQQRRILRDRSADLDQGVATPKDPLDALNVQGGI